MTGVARKEREEGKRAGWVGGGWWAEWKVDGWAEWEVDGWAGWCDVSIGLLETPSHIRSRVFVTFTIRVDPSDIFFLEYS